MILYPKCRFSTEDYDNAMRNIYPLFPIEQKITPEWFYLTCCDDCKEYRKFIIFICSHQRYQQIQIICIFCAKLFHTKSHYVFSCSLDCYVKYNTKPCIDYRKNFQRANDSIIKCSFCSLLIEHKIEKFNPKELRKIANIHKIKRENIKGDRPRPELNELFLAGLPQLLRAWNCVAPS